MKLSRCTNGSMRVLNTWAASGAAGSGLSVTSSPSFLAVRGDGRRRQRRTAASTSSSSSRPTPVLVETQTIGVSVPCRTASTISRSSSSFDGISPSKYFSITASSTSMIDSSSRFAELGRVDQRARRCRLGTSSVLTTPLRSCPWPSGTLNSTQLVAEHFLDRVDQRRESRCCRCRAW